MKLVTYLYDGQRRHGVLSGAEGAETVRDLGPGDLLAFIEADTSAREAAIAATAEECPLATVRLLTPLSRPPKLLALAQNYQDHITEAGLPPLDKQRIVPKIFLKPSSAIIGPDEPICLPTVSHTVDWEAELAVIIGRRCRNVSVDDALSYVFGYTIANDVSARTMDWDLTDREPNKWNEFFDWLNGKWPDCFAPLGPYIRTADEVPDPQTLKLGLRLNGESRQAASTADMIFSVAEAIAFSSRFMTLEPGDIIETGTPAGVGATTGEYVKDGDVMEAWIDGLGILSSPVRA